METFKAHQSTKISNVDKHRNNIEQESIKKQLFFTEATASISTLC
jgi:hypothetical protein